MRKLYLKKYIVLSMLIVSFVFCFTVFYIACNKTDNDGVQKNEYEINLTLIDESHFVAHEKITYINTSEIELHDVQFHLYPNAFREGARFVPVAPNDKDAYPNGKSYGNIEIKNVKIDGKSAINNIIGQDMDILSVFLHLAPMQKVVIEMDFNLQLANVRHRLGFTDKAINLGQWYPVACVFEDGSFVTDPYYYVGDPFYTDVSNYDVTITVPNIYKVASAGIYEKSNLNENTIYHSILKDARDFALSISKIFNIKTTQSEGVDIAYYYYDDSNPNKALEFAAKAIKTFNDMFGKYPYKTLAVVKTGFLHGGMEYSGLVMISDLATDEYIYEVIVHEIAHQWWYGVVGDNQVKNAWMDEALAEYSTTIFYEKNPEYGQTRQSRNAKALRTFILYCDIYGYGRGKDTPMNKPLGDYYENSEYAIMVYIKGQIMFDVLRDTIGDKAFFDGLKSYYKDYSFKNVKPDDMIGEFEKQKGGSVDLSTFFNSWLDGNVHLYG